MIKYLLAAQLVYLTIPSLLLRLSILVAVSPLVGFGQSRTFAQNGWREVGLRVGSVRLLELRNEKSAQ